MPGSNSRKRSIMTGNPETGPRSMKYTLDEVLAGMLASIEKDHFTDDTEKLGEIFKGLSEQSAIFAPFGAIGDESDFSAAVEKALGVLERDGHLEHPPGRYRLTPEGRARCVTAKRTAFNASDINDLEAGAKYFDAHS
jgi:hypothetical protein